MEYLLLVEDDKELNQGLQKALKNENRKIISCSNLQSARAQLSCQSPSLVLLDINLPDGNGLEILHEIKAKNASLPVILLTANDTDDDVVEGLEQGADDYITKPFSLAVLRARVNTQLRKSIETEKDTVIYMDDFAFDFAGLRFCVNNVPVELSKTEQRLLRILVENRGNVVSRDTLIDRIWTDDIAYVEGNALSVTVKRLRDKLGAQDYIKTVYGIGYSWVMKRE